MRVARVSRLFALLFYARPAIGADARRLGEVLVSDLQVMLPGDARRVAEPAANDVERKLGLELRLSRRAEVLPKLGPRDQPRASDDPPELRAQVARLVTVPRDDVFLAFGRQGERFLEKGLQLFEDRDKSHTTVRKVLSLGAPDAEAVARPVNVRPFERELLGRAAEAAEAAQGEQQPPFGVGTGCDHFGGLIAADEVFARRVGHGRRRLVVEGIFVD